MTLLTNMKLLMPLAPDPPDQGMQAISDALEIAVTTNIRVAFVPGIGVTFLQALRQPNPFLILLSTYLDLTVTPIISTALSLQPTLGGPLPAWLTVQPSFDAIAAIVPPFMAGGFGALFWQAIILSIRLALPPPPPLSNTNEDDEESSDVVLRIDR